MHGGSTSARAALYALKDEELSINVQYSSNPWEQNKEEEVWYDREAIHINMKLQHVYRYVDN